MGCPVGQHRGAHVLRGRPDEADHFVDDVVIESGTLSARHRQAFGDIAARQCRDVVAAEHCRPPSGQHHKSRQRVDQ
ncbi:Uncharacterised protein [Mycobacterium tuberculosis]|uniref:Uncharacterized protein n=1 Tax=Mycobacterium tuberculosis TaxID=1773 RepID=A0A916LB76_MYCTX|nr:Uncharacterised protein [Mycobacterium tuberculosis]